MAQASDPQQSELINLLVQNLGVGAPHSTSREEVIGSTKSFNGQYHSVGQNGQNNVPSYHKEVGGQRKQLRESGEGDFNPFGTPYFQSSLATAAEPPGRDQEWQEYLKMMNSGANLSTGEGQTLGRDHQPSYPSGETHFVQNNVQHPAPYPPSFPAPYYAPNFSHAPSYPPTGYPPYPSYPPTSYSPYPSPSSYSPYLPSYSNAKVPSESYPSYAPPFGYSSEEPSPPLLHTFETVEPLQQSSPSEDSLPKAKGEEKSIDQVNGQGKELRTDLSKEEIKSSPPLGGSPTVRESPEGPSPATGKSLNRSWASIAITAKTSSEDSPPTELKVSPPVTGEVKGKVAVAPTNGFLKKDKLPPNAYGPAVDPKLVVKYPLLAGVNSTTIDCLPSFARFFVIKSYSEDDIHKSIKYNIWASTDSGNRRLDGAFKESASRGPIYLFYSVNASGQFCGLAQMSSPLDYNTKSNVWAQDKWNGQFKVKWLLIKDIPNAHLRHIRLTNNENKPVTNSRDTQEILFEPGKEMLRLFLHFKSKNSLLEDFSFYDKRQEEMEEKKTSDDKKSPEN